MRSFPPDEPMCRVLAAHACVRRRRVSHRLPDGEAWRRIWLLNIAGGHA